jgi:PAS domain S-box-containing protein
MRNLKTRTDDIDIRQENLELRLRLEEAEETLRAIREGEIDGLIVNSSQGEQIFTLVGADHSYRILIEAINEGALTLTADGIILYCNRSFARMVKTPQPELIGSSFFNLLYSSDLCNLKVDIASNEGMARREIDLLRGDGSPLPVYLSMNSMLMEGIEIFSLVITDLSDMKERASELVLANNQLRHEITERKEAEEALRQSEEKFCKSFRSSPVMMAIAKKEDKTYIDVNDSWLKAFGLTREEVIGNTHLELNLWVDVEDLHKKALLLEEHKSLNNYEISFRNSNGETRTGLASSDTICMGEMTCLLHTMIDNTEQKRVEKELARLDRLNLIGEMAASIGHEIRNPMTAVRGFIQMLNEQECYKKDEIYFLLMIEELDRANKIISEYLGIAKDKTVNLQPQYLDQVINEIYPLIEADANYKGINIKLDLGKPAIPLIDKNEIRQLLLNMARNAMEAMPAGGTLTIGTTLAESEIFLFIKDEGQGLPAELLDKLGTPFVTTKENGTGLGLAVCYSIAARHNATIDFETGLKGTTFYIGFPLPEEQILLF